MKTILLLILSISFLSCTTTEHYTEQCSPVFSYYEENSDYIDVKASKCLCRPYKFSKEYVGGNGQAVVKDLSYCDKVIGFPVKKYTSVATFWEDVRQLIIKNDSKKD